MKTYRITQAQAIALLGMSAYLGSAPSPAQLKSDMDAAGKGRYTLTLPDGCQLYIRMQGAAKYYYVAGENVNVYTCLRRLTPFAKRRDPLAAV